MNAPRDITETNRRVTEQFRAGGEVEGMRRDLLLLLTTVGRRSGEERVSPMMFHRDGERVLVVASNAGSAHHPAWYHNLLANPEVTVEIGDERYAAHATPTVGVDRDRVWAELKELYPLLTEHEGLTDREIPVVALTRA
jgi:deazaflavin-dependent oxidoreductase (nitroreductase family)